METGRARSTTSSSKARESRVELASLAKLNADPAGLSGFVATFVTFGLVPTGKADALDPFVVSFL